LALGELRFALRLQNQSQRREFPHTVSLSSLHESGAESKAALLRRWRAEKMALDRPQANIKAKFGRPRSFLRRRAKGLDERIRVLQTAAFEKERRAASLAAATGAALQAFSRATPAPGEASTRSTRTLLVQAVAI
jgi:hypothetical protein